MVDEGTTKVYKAIKDTTWQISGHPSCRFDILNKPK